MLFTGIYSKESVITDINSNTNLILFLILYCSGKHGTFVQLMIVQCPCCVLETQEQLVHTQEFYKYGALVRACLCRHKGPG